MNDKKKSIVVVLGMHRSGTSAITRGLQVMGVRLGNRLIPAMEGINDKGFWEDIDLNALNIEMLSTVGSDWHHLAPIEPSDVAALHKGGYFLRAVELLRQKTADIPVFGFKDPRVTKLLPFWKDVFSPCQFDVNYVLTLRHPLSVVKSLIKRDSIETAQSYLMWLGHVITSLTDSAGAKRVLVDYDRLMQSPNRELMRIAKCTDLEIDPVELQNYKSEFLDQGLRHTVYELNDLLLDDTCPPIVLEIYTALLDVASDKAGLDDLEKKIARWSDEFERLKSPLLLIDKLSSQKVVATRAIAERDGQIVNLNQTMAERDGQIVNLDQAMAERDGQIVSFNQAIAERDKQIVNLNQTMAECDGQIVNLTHTIAEYDELITRFKQSLVESEGQISNLRQSATAREREIDHFNQALIEREAQIANLNQVLVERENFIRKLITSKSWFVTKPMRWVSRVVRGDIFAAMDPIKKALTLSNSVDLSAPKSSDGIVMAAPITPTHPAAVILPVYRGVEMTKRCILSAMPGILSIPESRIIAINDASPDSGMQEMLEQLAAEWPNVFVVIKNEKNLGFVGTVNRGFAYFPQYDAILLNSDVIVPKDWLTRLIDEAYSNNNIGTVTPFSNNATICSFPHFLQENLQLFNLDVDSIDAVFRSARLPCGEAPTGVGFCMYIRRACLDEIGYFNEEKFGRGYGEENDLCQRALKQGWLNIISPNIYAYHEGGVSFTSDKQALVDRAMRAIEELHPNYHADVQNFIKHDPLKVARTSRYIQLLSTTDVPKVLHVSHAIGGGVGQHIEELAQYFEQRIAPILLTPHGDHGAVSISLGLGEHADKLVFNMPAEYSEMTALLKAIGISAVHFHHTVGLNAKILDLPNDLGVIHLLTVHDFYWLNGNPTLTDEHGKYPGYYSDTLTNPLYSLPEGLTTETFRTPLFQLIKRADCVIFPSDATKLIFNKVFPLENSIVASHVEIERDVTRPPLIFTRKDNYTIGVLGAIGREKGADLLEELALTVKNRGVPFEFKLLGYAYRSLKAVEVTGPYSSKDLIGLIQLHKLDVIFFPAQCPETYSYTLSYALNSGLPIIAPKIGAFPERLSRRVNTLLYNHLSPAAELIGLFITFIEKLEAGRIVKASKYKGNMSKHDDYYRHMYLESVARDLKVSDPNQVAPSLLNRIRLINKSEIDAAGWRKAALVILWRLYMHRSMQWAGRIIPFSARRSVKRFLSVHPMHDILKISGSKKIR